MLLLLLPVLLSRQPSVESSIFASFLLPLLWAPWELLSLIPLALEMAGVL
jgi:hypothetical protein